MCDSSSLKCGRQSGDVVAMPAWLKCPPSIKERQYPVPEGVLITPITQGGRNAAGSKKSSKRGECCQISKPSAKPEAKPNAAADCPMMKARACITSMENKEPGEKVSLVDKIKNLLGIGKVPDKPIFRKDGCFLPLVTKVECQGYQEGKCGCPCGGGGGIGGEAQVGEEVPPEDEEIYEEDDADVEFEDDEDCEDYEDEDGTEEGGAVETVIRQENMICKCTCIPDSGGAADGADGGEVLGGQDEECVEDAQGECVLEESAECMDPACQFFLEDRDNKFKRKENFNDIGNSPEERQRQECLAMNNFIIRVQSPFSETSTNATCEEIIARLTNKMPFYPEPEPRSKKNKKSSNAAAGGRNDGQDVKIVVKNISVEDPSCECEKPVMECKNEGKQKKQRKNERPANEPPPPPPQSSAADDECDEPQTPPPPIESSEPVKEEPDYDSPPPPPPNDCEMLSEEELLKKPLKDIRCGCPQPMCSSNTRGSCYGEEASVWTPPPPPPCLRCGAAERGGTDECYLCNITRRMRSGVPEIMEEPPNFLQELQKSVHSDSCTPEYLEDGSMKYKGGMCMKLAGPFLWHLAKRTPPGGFFDRYTGECGEEVRLKSITGTGSFPEAISACYMSKGENLPHQGGNSMENARRYLWGLPPEEEDEKNKRQCKPPPEKASSPPPDQCPPR